jgi:hypothetical protein
MIKRSPFNLPSHVPTPMAARLSRSGVLSWKRHSERQTKEGKFSSIVGKPRKVDSRLWQKFASVADQSDEEIREFSGRWGPLDPIEGDGTENITKWRRFALLASALLQSSIALAQDQLGRVEDWRVIADWLTIPEPPQSLPRLEPLRVQLMFRRLLLIRAVNQWFARSQENGILLLSGDQIVVCPSSTTLFGIIGVQLAQQIARAERMDLCFHCKQWFVLDRMPSNGGRRFCEHCRKHGKPQMYAARDYRRRTKESEAA